MLPLPAIGTAAGKIGAGLVAKTGLLSKLKTVGKIALSLRAASGGVARGGDPTALLGAYRGFRDLTRKPEEVVRREAYSQIAKGMRQAYDPRQVGGRLRQTMQQAYDPRLDEFHFEWPDDY